MNHDYWASKLPSPVSVALAAAGAGRRDLIVGKVKPSDVRVVPCPVVSCNNGLPSYVGDRIILGIDIEGTDEPQSVPASYGADVVAVNCRAA